MADTLFLLGPRLVDLDAGVVRHGDETTLLSERELQLLELLHREANQPVARKRILVEAFGYSQRSASRTVDMTVKRLRSKIEPDPGNPSYLLTEYGRGYSLRVTVPDPVGCPAPVSPREAALLQRLEGTRIWIRLPPGEPTGWLDRLLTQHGRTPVLFPPVETTPRLPEGTVVVACDEAPFGWNEIVVPRLRASDCREQLELETEAPTTDAIVDGVEGSPALVELVAAWLRVETPDELVQRIDRHQLAKRGLTLWCDQALNRVERLSEPLLGALWCRHRSTPISSLPGTSAEVLELARRGWIACRSGSAVLTPPFRHIVEHGLSATVKQQSLQHLGSALAATPPGEVVSRAELAEYTAAIEHHPEPEVLWPRFWVLLDTCAAPAQRLEVCERWMQAKRIPTPLLPAVMVQMAWDRDGAKMDLQVLQNAHRVAVSVGDVACATRISALLAAQDCERGDIRGGIATLRAIVAGSSEPIGRTWARCTLGFRLHYHGVDPVESAAVCRAALADLAPYDQVDLRLDVMTTLGAALLRSSDASAEVVYEDALRLASETGRFRHAAILASGLGWSLLSREDERALTLFHTSSNQAADDPKLWIQLMMGAGWAQLALRSDAKAATTFRRVRRVAQRAGDARSQALAHFFEGIVEFLNEREERGAMSWRLGEDIAMHVMEDYGSSCDIARDLLAGIRTPQVHWEKIVAARVQTTPI